MIDKGKGATQFARHILEYTEDRVFEVQLSDKSEAVLVKDQLKQLGCLVDGPDRSHWLMVVKPY